MIWKEKLKVTIKRLHNPDTRINGAYVDLLIHEQNILRFTKQNLIYFSHIFVKIFDLFEN